MQSLSLEELERVLKALANANRLKLLGSLRAPQGYADLDLTPTRADDWGRSDRRITRQAIRHHLRALMDIGVVTESSSSRDGERRFVLDHPRLFSVVESMRRIVAVQAAVEPTMQTMELGGEDGGPILPGPHLVLVRGVGEGRGFPLKADHPEGAWRIGRARRNEVSLDYDPYVSSVHAHVLQQEDGFYLMDDPGSKNGTYLNWRRLADGSIAPLRPGDVIGAGLSLLVLRA